MLTWNRKDSTPLSAAPRAPKGDQRWIFGSYKSNYLFSLSGLPQSGPYQDEDKKSAINKNINSQIKKPHLKMIPIKDNYIYEL